MGTARVRVRVKNCAHNNIRANKIYLDWRRNLIFCTKKGFKEVSHYTTAGQYKSIESIINGEHKCSTGGLLTYNQPTTSRWYSSNYFELEVIDVLD